MRNWEARAVGCRRWSRKGEGVALIESGGWIDTGIRRGGWLTSCLLGQSMLVAIAMEWEVGRLLTWGFVELANAGSEAGLDGRLSRHMHREMAKGRIDDCVNISSARGHVCCPERAGHIGAPDRAQRRCRGTMGRTPERPE